MSDRDNSKLRFLISPDEELADGSSKILGNFYKRFCSFKDFIRSDTTYSLPHTVSITNTDRTNVNDNNDNSNNNNNNNNQL